MKKFLSFIVLLTIHWSVAHSQNFSFSHLTENEGLSYNVVNCFMQDHRGVLWIGTYNGFSRFDGNNFFNHKIRKGKNTMLSEVVHSLCEDRNGNIWGGTDNGVFCYIPSKDSFINYSIRSLKKNGVFFELLCDKQGVVWASGLWSLFRYDSIHDEFQEIIKTIPHDDSMHTFKITKNGMVESADGQCIWLATSTGLLQYIKSENKIVRSKNETGNPLFTNHSVAALCLSPNGNMWFFDHNTREVIQFNPNIKQIVKKIQLEATISDHAVATIFEDRNQRLWLCTWQYDMLVIELNKGNRIHRLENKPEDRNSIATSFIWDAFQDKDDIVWLGTLAGISKTCPERDVYRSFQWSLKIPVLRQDALTKVAENPKDSTLWASTKKLHLIHYNPVTEQTKVYDLRQAKPNAKGESPGPVNAIQFYKNEVIVSTYTGTWVLKSGTNQFTPFRLLPPAYQTFLCAELLLQGDTAAYYNSGREILYWNRKTNRANLLHIPIDNTLPKNKTVITSLGIGPNGGYSYAFEGDYVNLIDPKKKSIRVPLGKLHKEGSGGIFKIGLDSKSAVWIAYRGSGLYCYDANANHLSFWNETDGLPGNRIHDFAIDQQDGVWVMMYNKVSVFIPATKKFYSFKIPFSENNYFYINAMSKSTTGHILGSINNELFEFYPEKLYQKPVLQKPVISALLTSDTVFNLHDNNTLTLPSHASAIRFVFGSLISRDHFSYDLQYQLAGADKTWTVASTHAEALYNNLQPGDYTFKVRAVSKNADWQTEEAELHFTIKTPWYKTWIAYLLYFTFGFGAIYRFYRFKVNKQQVIHNLESKTQRLEREKAMVMYESLKQQLNPHFLFNSLSSLNSLIGRDAKTARQFLDSLSKTYRYILKSRDHETVTLSDEIRFAQNYIKLQKTRFEDGFEVIIDIPSEYDDLRIVPVTLQNLIENAMKHNTTDAENPLVIKIYTEEDYLVIENNLQPKDMVETSNKQGLANLQSLYRFMSDKPVFISHTAHQFIIKLPLLEN
jgi:ligand-binding sensor domain-containing protein